MTQTIEQLQAKIAELEAEVERLKRTNSSYANLTKAQESQLTNLRQRLYQLKGADSAIDSERQANCDLTEQLAAEQLNNKRLRDALNQWIGIAANCSIESGCCGCGESIENHSHPMMCGHSPVDMADSVVREAIDSTDKALSTTASTEALDKYVAEKVKDSESRTGNQSPCYTIARDMAVRMWEKHYKTDAPNWEPLDDFMGVLSQISNMLTGLGNVEKITRQRDLAVEALEKIAAPIRADGTYNRCREACEILARETLSAIKESEGKR